VHACRHTGFLEIGVAISAPRSEVVLWYVLRAIVVVQLYDRSMTILQIGTARKHMIVLRLLFS
jgi:hypothetical protein